MTSLHWINAINSKFKTSLGKSLSANFLHQISSVVIQIVGVPILISSFGVMEYGEYLALSAIPTFLFFADLGLGVSLSNQMTVHFSAARKNLAQLYGDSLVLFTIILITFLCCIGLLFFFIDIRKAFNFLTYSNLYYQTVFYVLLLTALLYNISGMIAFFLRAIGKNSVGVTLSLIHRVATTLVFWMAAVISKDMLYSSITSLLLSFILIFAFYAYYRRMHSVFLTIKIGSGSKKILLQSLKPGLAYLLFPVGNAILNQGLLIIISRFIGAPSVVLFSTVRTLTNVSRQMTGLINNSVWPELTIAYGAKNYERLRRLLAQTIRFSVLSSAFILVCLWLLGPFIFKKWVGDKVEFDYWFFFLMAIPSFFYALWSSAAILPFALNRFEIPGIVFLVVNVVVVFFILLYSIFSVLNIYIISWGVILVDVTLSLTSLTYLKKIKTHLN